MTEQYAKPHISEDGDLQKKEKADGNSEEEEESE